MRDMKSSIKLPHSSLEEVMPAGSSKAQQRLPIHSKDPHRTAHKWKSYWTDCLGGPKEWCLLSPLKGFVQSRLKALVVALCLMVPVVLTLIILRLSWRNTYWTSRSINQPLALLQIAAKLHDILITFSLSQVLLYHTRKGLMSEQGSVFGLFSTAYGVSFGSLPLSKAFEVSLVSTTRSGVVWQTRFLVCLILLTSIVGLAANPATSISLLPRLEWWPAGDLFYFMDRQGKMSQVSQAGLSMYIPADIFPTEVNASSRPRHDDLDGLAASSWLRFVRSNNNSSDPISWAQDHLPQYLVGTSLNMTFDDSYRSAISQGFSRTGSRFGMSPQSVAYRTDTLITDEILVDYLNLVGDGQDDPNGTAGGPWTLQVNVRKDLPKVPRANVWCDMQPATLIQRNLSLIFGDKNDTLNPFLNDALDLSSFRDKSALNSSKQAYFEWTDLPQVNNSMLGGLLMTPSNQYGDANMTVCVVLAEWSSTSMWAMPNQNTGILSNFTSLNPLSDTARLEDINPSNGGFLHETTGSPIRMVLRREWADSLNPVMPNSSSTLFATLMEQAYNSSGFQDGPSDDVGETQVQVSSRVVSAVIADALGRIGSDLHANWGVVICRKGWCSTSAPQYAFSGNPVLFNGTVGEWNAVANNGARGYWGASNSSGFDPSLQVMYSFPQPPDYHTKWTEISLQVSRYGYGWGFKGKIIKAAAAFLILHAIIIFAHCCHLVAYGKCYSYAGSIGELLALALKSAPPQILESSTEGISSDNSIWSQPAALRRVKGSKHHEEHFEIALGPECREGESSGIRQRLLRKET